MNIILFDTNLWDELLPITFTRPVGEIRVGILTIAQKWQNYVRANVSYSTRPYLQKKYPQKIEKDNFIINSAILPDKSIVSEILQLEINTSLTFNNIFIAARYDNRHTKIFFESHELINKKETKSKPDMLTHVCDIFSKNGTEIYKDFEILTKGRKSEPLSETNAYSGPLDFIFIEKGAIVEHSILNSKTGPIYIGKNAEIMEGSVIRGPFALCEHAVVKMAAKIYGPTTIGPESKVGGEVNNSVILGYSNKAHDGFLGNSVIGEWCNLGADTNNSNLKNNYAIVKMWNYPKQKFISTGLQFAGLIMGDHSKCGINTMFNTGTVVGISCNLFGDGFHRNFVPSFSWGGPQGYTHYQFEKAIETAQLVMQRRNKQLNDIDIEILQHIYNETEKFRNY
ncbi:MAG: GlmU family protein [Bacteroidales bacterium]|nr:GlmU family protein [Bacteroidales bacterium]